MTLNRFRSQWLVEIDTGRARVRRGRPPPGFVSACDDIARLHRIAAGAVECVGSGRHARLKFSGNFPDRGRQAIRNVWTPPTTPGPKGGRRAVR
ncbi:DUF3634 family protein [Alkalilimnicola sp. S0819]|uniref:DUF3634 family protein n=1 Tax=Alkalilimnicola sp. S0819 TaxID=2613922 RepID=UPI001261E9B7|nr:DUF3634 family protein [Alkalilimnicola sp. S0819]KAB7627800.1 DUF3634 family protein [Alkalilimnicola sp. S0819]MPQ15430.1 DUF3634 family protein [Alkalilimnicola sp. S0819]